MAAESRSRKVYEHNIVLQRLLAAATGLDATRTHIVWISDEDIVEKAADAQFFNFAIEILGGNASTFSYLGYGERLNWPVLNTALTRRNGNSYYAELVAFAELAQLPVLTTMAGKSAFPETHPLALGTGGNSKPLTVSRFLQESDFVLAIGSSLTRNPFTTPIPASATVAQVTNCGEDVGKASAVAAGAVGDAQLVLEQLIGEYAR